MEKFWWQIFLTANAWDKRIEELVVPCDDAKLSGSFDGEDQIRLELRRYVPPIPYIHRDTTERVWERTVSGKFKATLSSGRYLLIATSPRSPLPNDVVDRAVKVLESRRVADYTGGQARIRVLNSEIDLVTFLEQDFLPLKNYESSPELLDHLERHHRKLGNIGPNVAKWDQHSPGLLRDLAEAVRNVANPPSVIGVLSYQVSCLKRLPEWLFDLGMFLVGIGITLLLWVYPSLPE